MSPRLRPSPPPGPSPAEGADFAGHSGAPRAPLGGAGPRPRRGGPGERLLELLSGPAVAGLFGFFAFLPYPAVAAGGHSAVQIGNLFALLVALPCLFRVWSGAPVHLAVLMVCPMTLSMLKVAWTGGDVDLSFKSFVVTVFSGLALVATQRLAPRRAVALMTGIAAATALHAAVGFWQLYAFPRGQFPLLALYVNPSFLSVQENADVIMNYIRRPFGLFPEPSAMSSSLAPWALFWVAEALGLVRLREPLGRRRRAFFVAAAAGAVALIIISRSGHAMITLAMLVLFAAAWAARARATARTYLALVSAFCVVLPLVIWFAAASLEERIGTRAHLGDDSWHERASSLRIGFSLLADGDPLSWLFGLGPGLTTPAIHKAARLEAVWSVLLPYLYQTGLVGAAALGAIGLYLARVWRATGYAVVFAAVLVVWLVGVTLTTSYSQLLPLWVALGWLTVWPEVCEPAPAGRRWAGLRFVSGFWQGDSASLSRPPRPVRAWRGLPRDPGRAGRALGVPEAAAENSLG